MHEAKFGFIPGSQDTAAWRLRRRFRLTKGGNPQLVLVHYTRGQPTGIHPYLTSLSTGLTSEYIDIIPSFMNQPVRPYPLRPVTEPAVYVLGDKYGQKVYPPGTGPTSQGMNMAPGMPGMPMSMGMNPQAMLAQQNSTMELLERRRAQERQAQRARERTVTNPPVRYVPTIACSSIVLIYNAETGS
jgi:hypothetical protein